MGVRTWSRWFGLCLLLSACDGAPQQTGVQQGDRTDDEGDGDGDKGDGEGDGDEGDGDAGDGDDQGDGDAGDGDDQGDGDAGDGDNQGEDGPADGDPSKPVVTISEAKCGVPTGGLGPLGSANVKIGGRDVVVGYPCSKHEGAAVTVILLLHGTQEVESAKFYTHGYFAAYKLVDSHNLIVVEPKSVVRRWAQEDGGKDTPHLYEVIDWVYEKFAKYNLTGLWVAGHSWGAMFAKTFVCDAMLEERARGVIGMSGGTSKVTCGAGISQIHTVGDADTVAGMPDQTTHAKAHGCGNKTAAMDMGDGQMRSEWPDCDEGFAHAEYTMGDHDHITPINPEVVEDIIKRVKATE
jgi:pimeloyl-ACP methyl ester carboxylesterase